MMRHASLFETGTVHRIKSISQRSLAFEWDRLHDGEVLPCFDAFKPSDRMHDPKQLAVWAVEGSNRGRQFRALYQGSFIAEATGTTLVGKTLDEVTPPSLLSVFRNASDECASSACAVYTVLTTYNGRGEAIDLERLLLPFGNSRNVEVIVASLQLVSLETQPQRRSVAKHFEQTVIETVKLRIRPTLRRSNA